ncbi:toll/interleukin-1 receptor domain-containing protein [Streptomyces sp. NPDC002776]
MKIAFFLNGSEPTFRIMSILAEVARDMGFDSDYVDPDVSLHGNHERVRPGDVAVLDITRAALRQAVELGSLREAGVRVVLIAASSLEIPGDLSGYRTLIYGNSLADSQGLIHTFRRELRALEEKPDADPSGWSSDEKGNRVFISYSHTDEQYLRRLLVHLRPLDRQGMINVWSDQRIDVGDPWREKIEEALEGARIAVLLISADFLASDFIVNDELPPLLAKAQGHGTRILPVIIKACRFVRDPQLSKFQAANNPKKPLAGMAEHEQEVVYDRVAEAIENVVQP